MRLTVSTTYGLRSLIFLASNPDRLCSIREISIHYNISYNHLVKVVQKLSRMSLVVGLKGRKGGIRLAKDAKDLRFGDIVYALEPNMHQGAHYNMGKMASTFQNHTLLKSYLLEANRAFIDSLNIYSIADAMRDGHQDFPPVSLQLGAMNEIYSVPLDLDQDTWTSARIRSL